MPLRAIPTVAAALLVAVIQTACSTNPATGEQALTLLSWEEEKAMGAQAAPEFTAEFGGPVQSPAVQAYIDRVGADLVAQIEPGLPPLPWEFTLLDSSVINAFALPGGKVFLTRGLASKLKSEAQLAGVLGHEVGHVTARHANQRISKQIGFNLALGVAAVGVGAAEPDSDLAQFGQYAVPALAVGGNVILLKYGRDEESQADKLGMRYMSRAGYNPAGQMAVMRVLAAESGSSAARPPEWLSTHPFPESRIDRIREILARQYPGADSSPEYTTGEAAYEANMLAPLGRLPKPSHGG